jgi:hypothetical protein
MKLFIKVAFFFFLGILIALLVAMRRGALYPSPDLAEVLAVEFSEHCLSPDISQRPIWECYEMVTEGSPHQEVVIQHESGEQHRVLTFEDQDQIKFRFTPTQQGVWSFSTGEQIDINAERPEYAKGFVASEGNKWIRTATGKAFVPQFVMYDKSDLDGGLNEFVEGHGFTGFHITNLRDFMVNPGYFEAVVLKTYRQGGATHFWLWEDASRRVTPDTYGIDVDQLYAEIAARLAPIPGWTVGYGFDLFEWATAEEIEDFRDTLQQYTNYHHMVGGRGHKNQYREISPNLDYASWEWHRPSYNDYRTHIVQANGRPAFSEDRFRIRTPSRYPKKDYDAALTLQGLWDSAMAGGVANIWGHKPQGQQFSEPYPNKDAIKTYSLFIEKAFTENMQPDEDLMSQGYCLRDNSSSAICYAREVENITLDISQFGTDFQLLALDTLTSYKELEIPHTNRNIDWTAPYTSDWAFWIKTFRE